MGDNKLDVLMRHSSSLDTILYYLLFKYKCLSYTSCKKCSINRFSAVETGESYIYRCNQRFSVTPAKKSQGPPWWLPVLHYLKPLGKTLSKNAPVLNFKNKGNDPERLRFKHTPKAADAGNKLLLTFYTSMAVGQSCCCAITERKEKKKEIA